jgi:hypothetical protein
MRDSCQNSALHFSIPRGDTLTPQGGDISFSPAHSRVAMLRQEFEEELSLDQTLLENLLSVFPEETSVLKNISMLEEMMETSNDSAR